MVDRGLLLKKAGAVARHLGRVILKRDVDFAAFSADLDRQESILFNLQMAIQNCIDIAAHIVSDEGLGIPGSTNEIFYLLEESGYLSTELTEAMVKAAGFRNLLVHEYARLELKYVHEIAHRHVTDLQRFITSVLAKAGLPA